MTNAVICLLNDSFGIRPIDWEIDEDYLSTPDRVFSSVHDCLSTLLDEGYNLSSLLISLGFAVENSPSNLKVLFR